MWKAKLQEATTKNPIMIDDAGVEDCTYVAADILGIRYLAVK